MECTGLRTCIHMRKMYAFFKILREREREIVSEREREGEEKDIS